MNGNKKLVLIGMTLAGILLWNMPTTVSLFQGSHMFYDASAPCEKCHPFEISVHTGTDAHNGFRCESCHRAEPNVTYSSKNISGKEAHSSSRGSCESCHDITELVAILTGGNTVTLSGGETETLTGAPTTTLTAGI